MGLLGGNSDSDDSSVMERGGFKKANKLKSNAKRVIDEEAGVVIYAGDAVGTDGYGMAAVPIEDTNLTLENESEDSEGSED